MRWTGKPLLAVVLGAACVLATVEAQASGCGQSRPCAGGYNPYNPASYNSPAYYGPNAGRMAPFARVPAPLGGTHLVVRSGSSVNVYKTTSIDPDCRSRGRASVRLVTSPQGGRASVVAMQDYVAFRPDNPRSACNRRKVAATEILYRANRGFVGTDTFRAEIIDPDGVSRTRQFSVEVR